MLKSLVAVAALIIMLTVIRIGIQQAGIFDQSPEEQVANWVAKTVEQANQQAPITIDAITTLNQFEASNRRIIFHYTVSELPFEGGRLPPGFDETAKITDCLNTDIFETVKKLDPDGANNFTLVHRFSDKDGQLLTTVSITPSSCRKAANASVDTPTALPATAPTAELGG